MLSSIPDDQILSKFNQIFEYSGLQNFVQRKLILLKSIYFKSNLENSYNYKISTNGPLICVALARKYAAHLKIF